VPPRKKKEFFFRSPTDFQSGTPGFFSVLFLLRNDLTTIRSAFPDQVIWVKAMVIMTGIDLLAQILANSDKNHGGDKRFQTFVETYVLPKAGKKQIKAKKSRALYDLRNALLHSFALSNSSTTGKTTTMFRVAYNDEDPLVELPRTGTKPPSTESFGQDAIDGAANFGEDIYDKKGFNQNQGNEESVPICIT